MLTDVITHTPEFDLRRKHIELAYQHAQEWQDQLAFEISHRSDLEAKYQEQTKRMQTTKNYIQEAAVLTQQLQQLKDLKHHLMVQRAVIMARQDREKSSLSE